MTQPSLDHLFLRFREKEDLAALGRFFDLTAPGLLGVGRKLLGGDQFRAEDLVQETFVAVLEGASAWDSDRPVLPWVVGILGKQVRREQRRAGRIPKPARLAEKRPSQEVQAPEEIGEERELRATVEAAIDSLPPVLRDVVRGKVLEDRSTEELAAELGLTRGALRVRLHRGLARLRRMLPSGLPTTVGSFFGVSTSLERMRAEFLARAAGTPVAKSASLAGVGLVGWWLSAKVLAIVTLGLVGLAAWGLVRLAENTGGTHSDESLESGTSLAAIQSDSESLDREGAGKITSKQSTAPAREPTPDVSGANQGAATEVLRGGTLKGKVIDEEGRPVPLAQVWGWNGPRSDGAPDLVTESNGRGAFTLDGLGPNFIVLAKTDDLVSDVGLQGELAPEQEAIGLELVVCRPWTLRGRVLQPDGRPAVGAAVKISDMRGSSSPWNMTETESILRFHRRGGEATTDEFGRFRLEGQPRGSVYVMVRQDPFLTHRAWQEETSVETEIRLDVGLRLRGRVADSAGQPAVGARIRYWPYYSNINNVPLWSVADAFGSFTLQGMSRPEPEEKEWYGENADPTGILVLYPAHAMQIVEPVTPTEGGQPRLSISLEKESTLQGVVVDENGRPIAGVHLRIEGDRIFRTGTHWSIPNTWEFLAGLNTTISTEDGSFRFDQLYEGQFTLYAFAEGKQGRYVTTQVRLASGEKATGIRLVMDHQAMRRVVLRGSITDKLTGHPLEEFRVVAIRDGGGTGRPFKAGVGQFELEGLESGKWGLLVTAPGYAQLTLPEKTYAEGEYDIPIELWPSRHLDVHVTNTEGKDQQGVQITGLGRDRQKLMFELFVGTSSSETQTDTEGCATLRGIPAQPVTLELTSGYASKTIAIDLTQIQRQTLEVVLDHIGEVPVQVMLLAGDASLDEEEVAENMWGATGGSASQEWVSELFKEGRLAVPKGSFDLSVQVGQEQAYRSARASMNSDGTFRVESLDPFDGAWELNSEEAPFPMFFFQVPPGTFQLHIASSVYGKQTVPLEASHFTDGSGASFVVLVGS